VPTPPRNTLTPYTLGGILDMYQSNPKAVQPMLKGAPVTQLPLNGATLGFEDTLWDMADQMRGHMDPAEYEQLCQSCIN
jgi:hypothetical protein